jgi:hypothetical protein
MPLQSSGQISLNDLHVEAGGTTGTEASMNDSDIRGLLNASANSQMTFSSFYGASSAWSTTGTVGGYSSKFGSSYAYTNQTGGTVSLGSIVDPTIDKLNGAIINRATEAYANTTHSINFGFYSKADPFSNPLGTNEPYVWSGGNSGWSTLSFCRCYAIKNFCFFFCSKCRTEPRDFGLDLVCIGTWDFPNYGAAKW